MGSWSIIKKGAEDKIILPKSDVAMKELFQNKKILRYFLSNMLDMDPEKIRSLQYRNTFLRRRHKWEKEGILDVVAEYNNDTKVNIELQVKYFEDWDKRQLFYLAKMYSQDLGSGQDYEKLKKCVAISILDFDLSDRPQYHSVYRLRDENGNEFSDVLEVHVLELRKKISGQTDVENWIRFFNAKSKEDLEMIKTDNPGIMEAIWELQDMCLRNPLRQWYEARMKQVRDDRAWRKYVRKQAREEGLAEGRAEGRAEGKEYNFVEMVCKKLKRGKDPENIAEDLEADLDKVKRICLTAKRFAPEYDAEQVFSELLKSKRRQG